MENEDDEIAIQKIEYIINYMKDQNLASLSWKSLKSLLHSGSGITREDQEILQEIMGDSGPTYGKSNDEAILHDQSLHGENDMSIDNDIKDLGQDFQRSSLSPTTETTTPQKDANMNDLESIFMCFSIGSISHSTKSYMKSARKYKPSTDEKHSGNHTTPIAPSEPGKFSFSSPFNSKDFTFNSPWSAKSSENDVTKENLNESPFTSSIKTSTPTSSDPPKPFEEKSSPIEFCFEKKDSVETTTIGSSDVKASDTFDQPSTTTPPMTQEKFSFHIGKSSTSQTSTRANFSKKLAASKHRAKSKRSPSTSFPKADSSDSKTAFDMNNIDISEFVSFDVNASESAMKENAADPNIDWESPSMRSFMEDDQAPVELPTNTSDEYSVNKKMEAVAEMYRKQGRDFYAKEDYHSALSAFEKALQQAPLLWQPRIIVCGNRAATLMMLGRLTDAVDACNEAIKVDVNAAKIYCRKGRALIRLGHFSEATESFQIALEKASSPTIGQNIQQTENKKIFQEAIEHVNIVQTMSKLAMTIPMKEALKEYYNVLHLTDELLRTCTHHRPAQIARAKAMLKLRRYADAKDFIEDITVPLPFSMHKLYAHPVLFSNSSTINSIPSSANMLIWAEISSHISVNIMNVVHFMLAVGSEMAELYAIALKNQWYSRSHCTEVMTHIKNLYHELLHKLPSLSSSSNNTAPVIDPWNWVQLHITQIDKLASYKSRGDTFFRTNAFDAAIESYTQGLEVCIR